MGSSTRQSDRSGEAAERCLLAVTAVMSDALMASGGRFMLQSVLRAPSETETMVALERR